MRGVAAMVLFAGVAQSGAKDQEEAPQFPEAHTNASEVDEVTANRRTSYWQFPV